ncbi:putative Ig domain-containing protein [Okeania hirsuta]|uniref:putative Ig domain-containing protein n=1 Tax=Okeania hirsuta TaxID=1458930 RepID=UPI000F52C411|nr:putative Ig domain-containing protein [Okeania hirsuta]RQH08835.1 hypothetical protein D4Z78_28985 [Okeania hirsuta]
MTRIYVQSRGISQDYQWNETNFDNNTQKQKTVDYPPLVKNFKDLLDSRTPSLLLARCENKLLLLVADIPSQRRDYMSRIIRNSVAWIGEEQDEQILRALAVRGLQSLLGEDYSFQEEINNAVKSDREKGFTIEINGLEVNNLAQEIQVKSESSLPSEIAKRKIAKIGDKRINELINELKEHKLPQHNGALVVVTGNKAQSALEEASVWRGVSKLVNSEDWIEVQPELEEASVWKGVSKLVKSEDWIEIASSLKKKLGKTLKIQLLNTSRLEIILLISVLGIAAIIILSRILENSSPNISGIPPNTVAVNTAYNFIPIAEDKDGDTLEFSIENQPNWLSFDEKTGKLSGTPTEDDIVTTPNIVITVSDGKKKDSLDSFSIAVKTTPVINGAPPTIVTVGTPYIFTPIAEDKDGDTLEFSIENQPKWLTFNQGTGKLSGTPNNNDIGTAPNIVISVSDGNKTDILDNFSITVNPETRPTISGAPPTIVTVGTPYIFTPIAEYPNGDTLEFSIENPPKWLNFDKKTGKLSGTPTEDDIGTTPNIIISVSDGNKTDSLDSFSIAVKTTPVISGAPPTIVTVGTPYIFTPIVQDPDGDTLEFSIENQPKWLTFNQGTGKLSGTPNNNDIGTAPNIVISVSDGNKTDILDNFSITVNPETRPTISGAPPTIVTVGTPYIFTPIAEDPNGDTLEFSIENPPKWLDFNETTGKLSGTPTEDDISTTPNIVIRVSDGKETISLPPFTVTVNP